MGGEELKRVSGAPAEGDNDAIGKMTQDQLNALSDAVLEKFMEDVFGNLKMKDFSLIASDIEGGVLKDDAENKLSETLTNQINQVNLGFFKGLAVRFAGGEGFEGVKELIVTRTIEKLNKAIKEKLGGFESFTKIEVAGKDLMQFDLKIDGVPKKAPEKVSAPEAPKPAEGVAAGTDADGAKPNAEVSPSVEAEKRAIGEDLMNAGWFGKIAKKILFQQRKDKDGNDIPSMIDEAIADPTCLSGMILGIFGFRGETGPFVKAWREATSDLPPQISNVVDSVNKLGADCRKKIEDAKKKKEDLGNGAEAVAKGLGVTEFMDRLKKGDEGFREGLKEELVVGGEWRVDGGVRIILPDNDVLKIPAGGQYGVTVDGKWQSNTPSAAYNLNGGADKSLVVTQLPPGTIIPVGSKIINLMKEEPAVS